MLKFSNVDTEIPLPNSTARVWEVCVEWLKWKEKKNFDKLIVAMPLLKWGNKKKFSNCDNGIAENGGKKSGFEIWGRVKKKKCLVHNIFTTFSQ